MIKLYLGFNLECTAFCFLTAVHINGHPWYIEPSIGEPKRPPSKEQNMSREYNRVPSGTVTFRTAEQAAIFDLELTGQFSDGHWENLRGDHWIPWCKAKVAVGENVGRDFKVTKDNYNVAARELLEDVGERMKGYARIAKVLGLAAAQEHGRNLVNWDTGLIKRPTFSGTTYDASRGFYDALAAVPGTLERINDKTLYEDKHLRADLREIKKTMKTFRFADQTVRVQE